MCHLTDMINSADIKANLSCMHLRLFGHVFEKDLVPLCLLFKLRPKKYLEYLCSEKMRSILKLPPSDRRVTDKYRRVTDDYRRVTEDYRRVTDD